MGDGNTNTQVDISNVEKNTSCKALLVIAEDRSGSTIDVRKLNNLQYKGLLENFCKHFHGMVAVRIIGNPEPADRDFFRLNIEAPYVSVISPEGGTLDDEALARTKNIAIQKENNNIEKRNNNTLDSFIQNIVIPKIEGYQPAANKDVTNITDALHHIQMLADEPDWADARIMVVFISDGLHDADTKVPVFAPSHPVDVFLVGTENEKPFQNIPGEKIHRFESVEGLIHHLNNQTCK